MPFLQYRFFDCPDKTLIDNFLRADLCYSQWLPSPSVITIISPLTSDFFHPFIIFALARLVIAILNHDFFLPIKTVFTYADHTSHTTDSCSPLCILSMSNSKFLRNVGWYQTTRESKVLQKHHDSQQSKSGDNNDWFVFRNC